MQKVICAAAVLILACSAIVIFAQVSGPGEKTVKPEEVQGEKPVLLAQGARPGEEAGRRRRPERQWEKDPLVTGEVKDALSTGLEWLCRMQSERGDWPESEWSLAVSSLAGYALASGDHPGHGRYSGTLRKFTDYILSSTSRRGLIYCHTNSRPALGHSFAILYLTQVYGMFDPGRNKRIRRAIKDGIRYILACQTLEGGWYEDYSATATHYWIITVSQIQALRAARCCGFLVPKVKIARAIKFVEKRHW